MIKFFNMIFMLRMGIYILFFISLFSVWLSIYVDYYKVNNESLLRARAWVNELGKYIPILICLTLLALKKYNK